MIIPLAGLAADGFDVSYLWHHDISSVKKYQNKVEKVLGPGVSKNLKVVFRNGLYGLIYLRQGDISGAQRVAEAHTKLLKARGLEAASPMRTENWNLIGNDDPVRAQQGERDIAKKEVVNEPKVPRNKMTGNERAQEIRDLEMAVEEYIKQLRQEGKIARDERTGWFVYDFTTGEKLVKS